MPALGLTQETGKIVTWLKSEGQVVAKGEPLLEIETDKLSVAIEAPAAGILVNVTAAAGDDVPVGQVIGLILAPGESALEAPSQAPGVMPAPPVSRRSTPTPAVPATPKPGRPDGVIASPLAARLAAEHNLDLRWVKPAGNRVEKADVLAYLQAQEQVPPAEQKPRHTLASPKARRLADERGIDLAASRGTGPGGAVLAADVLAAASARTASPQELAISGAWRVMAQRITQSWTSVPHFYLLREVNASRLVAWRQKAQQRSAEKISYTDLLVMLVATALREEVRLNAAWSDGAIILNEEVNIGLAVAVEDGLIVPVIHRADNLSIGEISARRQDLVARAQAGKLLPADILGGTFTISNLGMYGVDAFNAIINPPQAAILAVGRITDRVVPVAGQPAVQPMLLLSLSCDHRVVDGARGAQFLAYLAGLIEEPLVLLN